MKTNTKPTYKCDHCNKLYQIKSACKKHEEELCRKNPKFLHPCFECANIDLVVHPLYEDTGHGEIRRDVRVFHCKFKDELMYPGYVKEPFEFGDEFNEVMPLECNDWKDRLKHEIDHLFNL